MTFPLRRVLWLAAAVLLAAGCNIKDPLSDVEPTPEDGGADAGPTDTDGSEDGGGENNGGTDMESDVSVPDGGDDAGDDADMGPDPLSAANFFERYSQTLCAAHIRLDYAPEGFYWWTSEQDCIDFFLRWSAKIRERVAHDAERNRVQLDSAAAQALLDRVEMAVHPLEIENLSVDDVFIPKAGPGTPCASDFSCLQNAGGPATTCGIEAGECEGRCVPFDKICGPDVCSSSQYCDFGNETCIDHLADDEPCTSDRECAERCLVNQMGERVCGRLRVGDDCSNNRNKCPDGAYCAANNRCVAQSDEGGFCERDTSGNPLDESCLPGLICVQSMGQDVCDAIQEGDRCRNGVDCPGDLSCIQTAAGAPNRACYLTRDFGEPCNSSDHCPDDGFCNFDAGGVCEQKRPTGDQCETTDWCQDLLTCRKNNDSDASGACEELEWALMDGEACNQRAGVCSFGLVCDTPSDDARDGTCVGKVRPQVNGICEHFFECQNSVCDGDTQRCKSQFAVGQSCTENEDCETLYCDPTAGTCRAADSICP